MTLKIRILERKSINHFLFLVNIVHSMYINLDNAHLEIQILNCLYPIDVSNLIPMQMKQVGKIPETSDGK